MECLQGVNCPKHAAGSAPSVVVQLQWPTMVDLMSPRSECTTLCYPSYKDLRASKRTTHLRISENQFQKSLIRHILPALGLGMDTLVSGVQESRTIRMETAVRVGEDWRRRFIDEPFESPSSCTFACPPCLSRTGSGRVPRPTLLQTRTSCTASLLQGTLGGTYPVLPRRLFVFLSLVACALLRAFAVLGVLQDMQDLLNVHVSSIPNSSFVI